VLLEELTVRDGLSLADAVRVMQTTYRVTQSRDALYDLMQELAVSRGFGTAEAPPEPALSPPGESPSFRIERVEAALAEALRILSPEDRLLLAMTYLEQAPASGVARLLGLEPRPSLRRLERATEVVRSALLTQGLPETDVEAVLGPAPGPEKQALRLRWWKSAMPRPSH
jgi:DNA-directed RNA polymerase specialized sigma24 family protein